MKKKTKTEQNRLNYFNSKKLPFEINKTKKTKSSFDWSFLGFIFLLFMIIVSLMERSWSGAYSQEIVKALDQLSKTTYENQLIFEEITNLYKKDALESTGYKEPVREFIVPRSITLSEAKVR